MDNSGCIVICLAALMVVINAAFHPVDLTNLQDDTEPDVNLTDSSSYIRSWVARNYDPLAAKVSQADALTSWDYNTNITDSNQADTIVSATQSANFTKILAAQMKKFQVNGTDATIRRLYKKITELGMAALPENELTQYNKLVADMTSTYSVAKICLDESAAVGSCPSGNLVSLDPNITVILRDTRDPKQMKHIWKAWRDATGAKMRSNFTDYVVLKNKAAKLNGYSDAGAAWRSNYVEPTLNYTDENFLSDLDALWNQIRPLYNELHAYVRRRLIQRYPAENIRPDGPIPAHLLGNMWAQSWGGVLNFTQLFPNKTKLDVTDEMKRQNYTIDRMFKLSEQFQTEIGLKPMPASFWNHSMFERPDGREVVCHASAWDFYLGGDVRIKMCTDINMQDLITIHHEMGHIQYYLQYENQLLPFREGANSGFHEAVGDTLALSVATPRHLAWLGLVTNQTDDLQSDLNFMFSTALEKIVFLPFAYIMDRYRYDVFSGAIRSSDLNDAWWNYVLKYQGLEPPVKRTEHDFDPGSKYHISSDVEYMRYFISFVIQFQFHKALCNASGHTGPLYQCDINQSKAAGKLLSSMLSMGSSEPWPNALEKVTGSRKMDAAPLLEFFEPLIKYLHEVNVKNGDVIGWK
ncbi:Angiotensin-converting enzyme [Hypsibius exemplaris]|uniref:Angiotensin-converting enzyme n=1 Tax=Hypsibius exemplaris TaxID=2072580 RepID=A0A1W0XBU9_HYPEX|nr:Angiotensin-converting enzyme [Hypsibius exemplaris]